MKGCVHDPQKPTKGRKAKYRVGQVVCVLPEDHSQYGKVLALSGYVTVQFWDADQGDWWSWQYETKELRALTARERGRSRK